VREIKNSFDIQQKENASIQNQQRAYRNEHELSIKSIKTNIPREQKLVDDKIKQLQSEIEVME